MLVTYGVVDDPLHGHEDLERRHDNVFGQCFPEVKSLIRRKRETHWASGDAVEVNADFDAARHNLLSLALSRGPRDLPRALVSPPRSFSPSRLRSSPGFLTQELELDELGLT